MRWSQSKCQKLFRTFSVCETFVIRRANEIPFTNSHYRLRLFGWSGAVDLFQWRIHKTIVHILCRYTWVFLLSCVWARCVRTVYTHTSPPAASFVLCFYFSNIENAVGVCVLLTIKGAPSNCMTKISTQEFQHPDRYWHNIDSIAQCQ